MKPRTLQDRRFPCLNAIRAIAALGVVATHTAFDTGEVTRGWHGAVLSRLDFGVTLFFVLSGFLLSRPFFLARAVADPHPSYQHFVWKRGLRILPLYWVTVVACLLLLPENNNVGLSQWVQDLTLTQIYFDGPLSTGLTQMWSLCTEVAFYAILPALCWALLRIARSPGWQPSMVLLGLGLVAITGLGWQVVTGSHSGTTGAHYAQWLPGFLPWFAVGMAFAVISVELLVTPSSPRGMLLERAGRDLWGCWLLAGAVFALACTPLAGPRLLTQPTAWEAFFKCSLYAVCAAFLVLPLVFGPERQGTARRLLATPGLVWLGEVSYGIFCLHLIVLETVLDVLDVAIFTGQFQEVFLVTVAVTVGLSAISYYFLERPFLKLKNVGRFAPTAATPTAKAARAKS